MATEVSYTGDGSDTTFDITFPFLKESHIGVSVAGVTKNVTTDYTISGTVVTFTSAPANAAAIKIYRNTNIDTPEHDYSAGSSITAASLNDNQKQALYAIEEAKLVTTTSGGITTGNKNDITVNSDTDWVIRANAIEQSMMADNSVGANELANNAVDTAAIADDAVTADKLANSINTEIAANTAKVTNATHTGEVTGATALTVASNVIDEDNLKVDNSPTNDHVLTAKSSASGGLTWAAVTPNITKYAVLYDSKSSGTGGGDAGGEANNWQTRDLNTEIDPDNIVTLSSNQFTLGRGRYLIKFSTPGYNCNEFKGRLYDVTNSQELVLGSSEYANSGGYETPFYSEGSWAGNLTANTTFKIEWITKNSSGSFGRASSISGVNEIYTRVEIIMSDNPA
tara:strand:- start:1067 stop:2257 length:1191 start_codon:yes stop_codon:yes gene_type:complete